MMDKNEVFWPLKLTTSVLLGTSKQIILVLFGH